MGSGGCPKGRATGKQADLPFQKHRSTDTKRADDADRPAQKPEEKSLFVRRPEFRPGPGVEGASAFGWCAGRHVERPRHSSSKISKLGLGTRPCAEQGPQLAQGPELGSWSRPTGCDLWPDCRACRRMSSLFVEQASENSDHGLWIVDGSKTARGRGIFVDEQLLSKVEGATRFGGFPFAAPRTKKEEPSSGRIFLPLHDQSCAVASSAQATPKMEDHKAQPLKLGRLDPSGHSSWLGRAVLIVFPGPQAGPA